MKPQEKSTENHQHVQAVRKYLLSDKIHDKLL